MFPATSFAEPKLAELVPTLTGESNFVSWSTALKCALNTRDPHPLEILTGHTAQPAAEDPSLLEWTRNASTKPKHVYTSHQRKTAHTSECFQNPANADTNTNTNAAKSANVINTPALTSNPTVRFNNLFND
ncbi:hypothetical protein ACN42_g2773 [Penicillium freii]|uniref:Uncharacterized protein n=1 Tax=Penicillium freii TaxID=48697 RepID=A0A101MPF2_PENFR|nr:hypothetical protein ACN42_g2773 [Penicillium freii]